MDFYTTNFRFMWQPNFDKKESQQEWTEICEQIPNLNMNLVNKIVNMHHKIALSYGSNNLNKCCNICKILLDNSSFDNISSCSMCCNYVCNVCHDVYKVDVLGEESNFENKICMNCVLFIKKFNNYPPEELLKGLPLKSFNNFIYIKYKYCIKNIKILLLIANKKNRYIPKSLFVHYIIPHYINENFT